LSIVPLAASRRRYVEVAEQLLDAIASGEYPAGSRLPGDREIASMAGVSRPTAREAILALEIAGAVEVRHGAGVYVRDPARGSAGAAAALAAPHDLIEARLSIEPAAARLCAERATELDVAELGALLDEGEKVLAAGGPFSKLSELGLRFHAQLARCCGNSVLAGIVGCFVEAEEHPLWVLANELALRSAAAQQEQVREHRRILSAVAAGDAGTAAAEMSAHLQRLTGYLFGPSRAASAGAHTAGEEPGGGSERAAGPFRRQAAQHRGQRASGRRWAAGQGLAGRGGRVNTRPMHIRVVTPIVTEGFRDGGTVAGLGGPHTDVTVAQIAHGPASIESEFDEAIAVPDTLREVAAAQRQGANAVVIDCMADPGLRAARELVSIPVIGPAEASMHLAAMLGHRFSVVTVLERVAPVFENNARLYGVSDRLASVRPVNIPVLELGRDPRRLVSGLAAQAERAVTEDGAHVIIFGCTGMLGCATQVRDSLASAGYGGIPVVDPVPAAVRLAEALVALGLSHSKRTYPDPPQKRVTGYPWLELSAAGAAR
jgi:allantoin racemase